MADYGYDDAGQLESADYDSLLTDEAYSYDDNGNRDNYVVDAYNRVVYDGTYTYSYDTEGNRTAQFEDLNENGVWNAFEYGFQYTWDHRNRLTSVEMGVKSALEEVVEYKYDAFNQMIYRRYSAVAELGAAWEQSYFIYDRGQVVLEFDKAGTGIETSHDPLADTDLTHRYLWGPGVDQLLADEQVNSIESEGEALWAATDSLGSVRDVIDSAGTLRIHVRFDTFGNIVGGSTFDTSGDPVTHTDPGFVTEAFAFQGRWRDKTTGLQNNLFRWYDSLVGSWISEDPIEMQGDPSNWYRPFGNVPTMFVDPSGLEAFQFPKNWESLGCPELEKLAAELIGHIAGRFEAMLEDSNGLYGCPPGLPGGRKGTWSGHQQQYTEHIRRLEKLLKVMIDKGCKIPPESEEWLRTPPPLAPRPKTNMQPYRPPGAWGCLGPFPKGWKVDNLVGGPGQYSDLHPEPWWHAPVAIGMIIGIVVAPEVIIVLPELPVIGPTLPGIVPAF